VVTKINADTVRLEVDEELLPGAREFVAQAGSMNESNSRENHARMARGVKVGVKGTGKGFKNVLTNPYVTQLLNTCGAVLLFIFLDAVIN